MRNILSGNPNAAMAAVGTNPSVVVEVAPPVNSNMDPLVLYFHRDIMRK